jgi:glycosyltransferase involved in cell wall biosynthesis
MKNVSIVICAFNEESTIEKVVTDCRRFNPDSEIIVVDDGSKDRTPEIIKSLAEQLNLAIYILPANKGKSYAMAHGVEKSTQEIILFFDADVSNISMKHFSDLIDPLQSNEADMVLGQPSETVIDYRVNPFRSLTGERAVYKRDILPLLDDIRDIRFGVETFLNLYYQAKGMRIKYVLLTGLKHPTKYAKTSPLKATKEFVLEGQEIAVTLIENNDLIVQRVDYLVGKANRIMKVRVHKLQKEVNQKMLQISKYMYLERDGIEK